MPASDQVVFVEPKRLTVTFCEAVLDLPNKRSVAPVTDEKLAMSKRTYDHRVKPAAALVLSSSVAAVPKFWAANVPSRTVASAAARSVACCDELLETVSVAGLLVTLPSPCVL